MVAERSKAAFKGKRKMTFALEEVVPWGRSFEEYLAMFSLTEIDLKKSILGCGDGPASFNCVATKHAISVVSVDPLYGLTGQQIRSRIEETSQTVIEQLKQNKDEFLWSYFANPDALASARYDAMDQFLGDFNKGLAANRYIDASLPNLPLTQHQFDLALCSHFLFLYSGHLDCNFHIKALYELCRVAREVRVFPLLELGSKKSRHLDAVIGELENKGLSVDIVKVDYEIQRGGNEMLCIRRD